MTKANQKILYEHFMKIGRFKDAEEILKSFPDFKEVPKQEIKLKGKK